MERWERIRRSNYNRWYKWVKRPGTPEYLKRGWTKARWRRIARFRIGNEVREARYWQSIDDRYCRVCAGELATWEHVWERCRRGGEEIGSWQESVGLILGKEGEEVEEWMKELERVRGEKKHTVETGGGSRERKRRMSV